MSDAGTQVIALFLRGVNVGGVTIRKDPLQACLGGLAGVDAVRVVQATGNAVVRMTGPQRGKPAPAVEALVRAVAKALRESFGYRAEVIHVPAPRLSEVVDACPYRGDDPDLHCYVTLSNDPEALDAWASAAGELDQPHRRLTDQALAWTCPTGQSLTIPFAKAQTRAPLSGCKDLVTTRNLRTLIAVRAAASSIA